MKPQDLRLTYVFDPLCGWCYGFSAAIRTFHENHPDLPLEVISGGLFTGERIAPVGAYPFIAQANLQVTARSGAVFGAAFDKLLAEGEVVLDSETAAAGFAALRALAPERSLALASAVQKAFYMEGKDLNDPYTFQDLARDQGLDPQAVAAQLAGPAAAAAQADFARARRLGATSFPTVLLQTGGRTELLGRGLTPLDKLEAAFTRLTAS